ncbi:MAG TPA: glycosyltransferase [Stellaceae bacterium]
MSEGGRPLRILMTADAVGGVWPYALTLIEALGARPERFEVSLAVMGPRPSEAQRSRAEALPNLRLFDSDFRLEWMPGAERDIERSADWLHDLAQECRPGVIHLNGYAHAARRWPAPVVAVGHSCVLSWWRAVHGTSPPPEWSNYGRRVTLGLARADRVVAPTRAMLRALSYHYGLPRGGRVIANGCALGRFAAAPKEDFVLAAGRLWHAGKNLAALDAAAARLSWPVYVAGDVRHPSGRTIEPRAAHALGTLAPETLAEWMARAAVYALPARYEPFGLSVLEAAASGCALVLGDIPSLRELWERAAVFVPPEHPAALADAIATLMTDPRRRTALAAQAQRRAQNFSAARMAERYAELYDELTSARPATTTLMAGAD